MSTLEGELKKIALENIGDVICCPGGLEVKDKDFGCDISPTLKWRKDMLKSGMQGYILYQDGKPTGFVEYMPIERAPYPLEGEDLATIMCFHWASRKDEDEHQRVERELLKEVIEDIKSDFKGAAALAWDHPVHFPIEMFEDVGFSKVSSYDYISLMWKPFSPSGKRPKMLGPNFEPDILFEKGKLAVELGYSNRCPYSINDHEKVKEAVSELNDDRILFRPHRIDTKKEAIEFSRKAWNWNWLVLNGEEVDHMKKSKEELIDMIKKKLEKLN